MPLREKGSETNLGGVIIEYDPAAGPTNFMIGTEQVRGPGGGGGGQGGGIAPRPTLHTGGGRKGGLRDQHPLHRTTTARPRTLPPSPPCVQGQVFSCNRKAKNPADRVKYVLSGHHGPICGLKRNPFNSKFFLSIGV